MRCTQCGTEYAPGAKYCSQCAAPISPGPTPVGAPPSTASPAASPLSTSPTSGASQADRRLVTILFADISGFTSLSEKLDPEAVHDLVTACFDRLVPCIQSYDGTIDKFIGDEVMALFGAPVAHENDPERALRATLEMRDALAGFNQQHGVGLGVHFGVNTGLVYAGGVGGGNRQDYSVMGDAVNVAARLKGAAKSGEILVGADTYRQTAHLFDFQTAEALGLKGKAEPVAVCRLLSARAAVPTTGRPSRGLSSPLVGREEEMAAFGDRLTRLRAGEGGILIVTAEAGMGKSRLVAEVRSRAQKQGLSWLEGRTLSFGRTISYWPLLEIIQQDAGIDTSETEKERWAKLSARLTGLFKEQAAEILPYLATLLSLPVPENLAPKVRYLDGEAMGRQIYRATRLYFGRLAQERPIVVVFEDVHWLDGSSAALLEHLLPLTKESPILFWFVSRPEAESVLTRLQELSRSEYSERLTEITVEPLSPEESARLACNLVNLDDLPPRLRESIVGKAEGNPFYVEEVVRSLIDQGGVVPDPAAGRYRVTEKAAHIPIPDTLHGVIIARIDRLDEDLKQVLRLASVIGRTFVYRVLESIAEAERELDRSLADLEGRELIREKGRTPELEYIFKHALVQEATYESILLQRRKELHRKVALAIETLFAEGLEEFYSLLAYHYSKAEDWERAQAYLFKAGDQAGAIAADAEALAHYEEAVEAYAKVFGDKWDPLQRAALERKMGEALYHIGDHERARDYLYRALATLGSPFPESDSAVRRAIVSEVVRQMWHRLWPWFKPAAVPPDVAQTVEERCRVYQPLGWIEGFARQWRFLLISLIQLNVAEKAGLGWAVSFGASGMGMICMVLGLQGPCRSYIGRARQLAERGGWPAQMAQADLIACMYEFWLRGDLARAFEYGQRSWERYRRLGDIRSYAGIALGVAIHVPTERGEFEQGLAMAREMTQAGRDAGDHLTEVYGDAWESELLYMTGEMAAGEAGMRRAIDAILASMDYRIAAKVAGRLAACLLAQGRLEEAQVLLGEHGERVRKYGIRGGNATMVITGTATAALAAVESAEGAARGAALKAAGRACGAALKQGRLDATAFVPAYRLQGIYEWLRGDPRKAEEWWRKSLEHAAKLGARYEGALTMLEIGRHQGDREQLKYAESEFEAMGARFFLAEARRLLGRAEVAEQAVIS